MCPFNHPITCGRGVLGPVTSPGCTPAINAGPPWATWDSSSSQIQNELLHIVITWKNHLKASKIHQIPLHFHLIDLDCQRANFHFPTTNILIRSCKDPEEEGLRALQEEMETITGANDVQQSCNILKNQKPYNCVNLPFGCCNCHQYISVIVN